jgi:hypothetical protein
MYFGELALLRSEPRAATVSALTDCDLLELGRPDFMALLGPLAKALEAHTVCYGIHYSAKKARTHRTEHSCSCVAVSLSCSWYRALCCGGHWHGAQKCIHINLAACVYMTCALRPALKRQ